MLIDGTYTKCLKIPGRIRYPEKFLARSKSQHIKKPYGFHKHHWSYLEKNNLDIILLSWRDHKHVHRFMRYNQLKMCYFGILSDELLDTRDKHIAYIKYITATMPYNCGKLPIIEYEIR